MANQQEIINSLNESVPFCPMNSCINNFEDMCLYNAIENILSGVCDSNISMLWWVLGYFSSNIIESVWIQIYFTNIWVFILCFSFKQFCTSFTHEHDWQDIWIMVCVYGMWGHECGWPIDEQQNHHN